jgi:hypothetical protein
MVYTPEELDDIKKYQEKLEKRREYNRLYMANKRANDPEFYAKQKVYNAQRKKEIYNKNEQYVAKEREYKKLWNEKQKAETKRIKELIENSN